MEGWATVLNLRVYTRFKDGEAFVSLFLVVLLFSLCDLVDVRRHFEEVHLLINCFFQSIRQRRGDVGFYDIHGRETNAVAVIAGLYSFQPSLRRSGYDAGDPHDDGAFRVSGRSRMVGHRHPQ